MCKRPMHQSTLTLGDQNKSIYSTTHAESFSGRGHNGQELVFLPRDSRYPSQHNRSDLSNMGVTQAQTHSRDIHGPKNIIPHHVLHRVGVQNRAQNRDGFVMKEVTNPTEATLYQTTYQTVHCSTSSRHQTNESSGQHVSWHRHNIITGEEKAAARPVRPRRQSGESILWAARRWETHHNSLRLY
ncbi:uncharacterized protein LOC120489875 isoform X2 [Pimephales promelas]|uniref:uncharacterized protein LOC120489875 isoform X2 n=1 Tax=Pimephales promelas TaxID=90988 RepID=UPI001955C3C2|nr:uncharacterized protein LOC120489875 isoform X2 [Pimephales promelas]XP_039543017.1 uncharacterized protein LOC120489875 isoform X2 [Pimephales promelas]XP_039543018.1 uncharacterized protein LOC120489875 isoform X2 [Pimephales promelas]KAG1967937.1 hypothetical protein F2P79_003081 [Pimephales promelas]KAG1967938.1 hypothetical protein F2P79_003081 [Pimephales promelas]KAG1967939.1 hypothetical protein F2P79_003081 [Pimephales promelas]KAG1967940.1 hypothetical protein F2P79_003081 [Pimep